MSVELLNRRESSVAATAASLAQHAEALHELASTMAKSLSDPANMPDELITPVPVTIGLIEDEVRFVFKHLVAFEESIKRLQEERR